MAEEYVPDKEKDKTPEKLSEMEIGFRVTIIKMIKELRRGKDSLSEVRSFFYKELENIRNNQT